MVITDLLIFSLSGKRSLFLVWAEAYLILSGARSHVLPCIEDIRQFKAFIAYDCLVNPTHPLSNGKGGIELWLGKFPPAFSAFDSI